METLEKTLRESIHELNELVRQRRLSEGVERFYDADVVMIESSSEETRGKAENIARERIFEAGLKRWDAVLNATVVDERSGIAFNHWTIHFDHSEFGNGILEQIAMQQWRDGRIVREAFYKL